MPVDPREARKQAMMARMNKSKQTSEGGGLGFFRGDLENVQFWKCDEGVHELDIIPYFAGPFDPATQEGGFTYVLEVFEHRDVGGIEGQSFICLMKTYGKPCPICQHRQQLIQEGADEDLIKALRTSRYPRSIYNVVIYDTEQLQAKGVQVFHTSHWLMEQHLIKLAESSRREIEAGAPPFKFFADPDEGYSVKFERSGQGLNTRYIAHQLLPRNYQIHETIMGQAWQLDTLIHVPEYDEVYAAYWGTEDAPVGAVAAPSGMTRGGGAPAPAAAPVARGGAVPPETAEPVAEVAVAPVASAATAISQSFAQPTDPVCPGGGTYGVNSYELEYCERCEYWQACAERNNQILAAQQGHTTEQPPATTTPAPVTTAPAQPAEQPPPPTQPPTQPPATRQPVGGPATVATGQPGAVVNPTPVGRGRGGAVPPATTTQPPATGGGRRIVR
jgi:hypothetical protein